MAFLIETPQQELQQTLGQLMFENAMLRHEVERLQRELEAKREAPAPKEKQP